MLMERRDSGVGGFWRDGDQQAAGSLRVEEKIAIVLRNAFHESHAIANEIAVILQPAGEKSFARGFQRTEEIADGRIIYLEGHGFDSALGITQRHLPSVAQQAEPGNI